MGFNFDESGIASRYVSARALRPNVLRQWLDAIACSVGGASLRAILDLGCGTGRFTGPLQRTFGAETIGLDPSQKMLAQAAAHPHVHYLAGRAEGIPLRDESFDLVFVSMVWHHFRDPLRASAEIRRVLKPNRFLCIRTSTVHALDSYPYLQFFPTARAINARTLPSRARLVRWAMAGGFELSRHQVIRQQIDLSLTDYVARIAQRGLSDLARIPDAEFEDGLRAMHAQAQGLGTHEEPVVEPIDLFVFSRN